MKVLVTGASGFIGRYLLESLSRHDIPAVVVGRQPASGAATESIQCDLLANPDVHSLVAEAEATHLLHLAWYTEHGQYWTSPLNLRWVEASLRLVEAFCQGGGRHVVMAGTCAEYDWSYGYCREDATPLNPASLYGIAKDALRRLVIAVCDQHRVPCAWGRVFFPYGAGESGQRLLPTLIEVFQGKRPPVAVNATAYRDFLHASDIAEAFVTLLRKKAAGSYNISSGAPTQLAAIVREVAHALCADPQAVLDLPSGRTGEAPLLVGDNRKLTSLGWRQALELSRGITQTIQSTRSAEPHRRARA